MVKKVESLLLFTALMILGHGAVRAQDQAGGGAEPTAAGSSELQVEADKAKSLADTAAEIAGKPVLAAAVPDHLNGDPVTDSPLQLIRNATVSAARAKQAADSVAPAALSKPTIGDPVVPDRQDSAAETARAAGVATEAATAAAVAAMQVAAQSKRAAADAAAELEKKRENLEAQRKAFERALATGSSRGKSAELNALKRNAETAEQDASEAEVKATQAKKTSAAADDTVKNTLSTVESAKAAADKAAGGTGNGPKLQSAFGFSVGLGADFHSQRYIETASVNGTNQIVTIDKAYKVQPSVWAVASYTKLTPCTAAWQKLFCNSDIRPGMFFGAKLLDQSGESVTAVALGIQLSLVEQDKQNVVGIDNAVAIRDTFKQGWNVGIGYMVHKTQRLADGISEGQPLPAQYSGIKYSNSFDKGFVIMISRSVF
ncbi:hypothetical protein [Hydrocarboniphaga sp.]|uniref:hypothetical protein n=1 Tax=Hydrocarboniphaga sp. TaxID=2033016 RepID=UPI003D142DA0